MPVSIPPPEALVEFLGPTTRHTRRVEIYESDGKTRWFRDTIPRIKEGSVSVDYDRDERRAVDLTFSNDDEVLINAPGEFWYDKILKVYRGVQINSPVRLPRILVLSDSTTEPQAQSFRAALADIGYGDVQVNTLAANYVLDMSGFDIMVALGDDDKGSLLNQAYLAGKSVFAFRRGAEFFLNAMLGTSSWASETKTSGQKLERRRNYLRNPSAATAATDWGSNAGTGGAGTMSYQSGTGRAAAGFARYTWTTANTAGQAGIYILTDSLAAMPGNWAGSMWVRSSVVQTIALRMEFKNTAGALISTATGPAVVLAANTWTRLTVTGVAPADCKPGALTAYSNTVWPVNATLDGDDALIEKGTVIDTYFDGATTNTPTRETAWVGTANLSQSVMNSEYLTFRVNYADNGRPGTATSGWAGASGTGGASALSLGTSGGPVGSANFVRRTWTTASTAAAGAGNYYGTAGTTVDPYVMDVVPGERVYAGLWTRSSISQRMMTYIQYYNAAGVSIGTSPVAAANQYIIPANTWTFSEVDHIVPANAVRAIVMSYSTTGTGSAVWPVNATLDTAGLIVQRPVTDDTNHTFFDGASATYQDMRYEWESTAYASVAMERMLDPALLTARNVADPRTATWTSFMPASDVSTYKAPAVSVGQLFGVAFAPQTTNSWSITSSNNDVGGKYVGVHFPINAYQYSDYNFRQFLLASIKWLNPVVPLLVWETQIGEFMIDRISEPHFPHEVKITGRDYTKKCMLSKFSEATQFDEGLSLEVLISSLAYNAGITKQLLPTTGVLIGQSFFFERATSRWDAMKEICTAYNYEIYFDATGYLVIRPFRDPSVSAPTLYIETGVKGQIASYTKSTSDASLFNHVLVSGESSDSQLIPVYAQVSNNDPTSPTSIDKIGDRYWEFVSAFITTPQQALDLATSYLAIKSLEEFELSFETLLLPWVEVGDIMGFVDPNPAPGDPNTFLLSNITLPLSLGPMSGTGRRVTSVGDITTNFNGGTRWNDVSPSTTWNQVPDGLRWNDLN